MTALAASLSFDESGAELHGLLARLFPIGRSLTGAGVRDTIRVLGEYVPLTVHEIPTGTPLFDWVVPPEWNVRSAWIEDEAGARVVDIARNNLHLVGYSIPVHARMTLEELQPHLHSLPDQPDRIPYRTSYHHRAWGFCLSHHQRERLVHGSYLVSIDATLEDGSLTYAECVLPGRTTDEVIVYSHTCHPSLANDNLSGLVVTAFLARWLATSARRYTYRFVFGPGTLGSLAWLDRNRASLRNVRHGFVSVLLGHGEGVRYKRSRRGTHEIDRVAAHVLLRWSPAAVIEPFSPFGYDERQFGSPGFDLPVGRLSRTAEAGYPEYHTSADDIDFVTAEALADSLAAAKAIVATLERNGRYRHTSPFGEPQLGRRGLYGQLGGPTASEDQMALLWTLNQSDGTNTLVDIADRAGLSFAAIRNAADALLAADLLVACEDDPTQERR